MKLKGVRVVPGTKISHDYQGSNINMFSLEELIQHRVESIGIPAKQNRLLVVDVDVPGPTHQYDGREWWTNFCTEFAIPATYTVQTPSGGFHFYYKIPEIVDIDQFSPPAHPIENGEMVKGVDFKFNGWVGAPPTAGYHVIYGSLETIADLSPAFLSYLSNIIQGRTSKAYDTPNHQLVAQLHRPFTQAQLNDLRTRIQWVSANGTLSRDEWRDGIFALKAGCEDTFVMEELVTAWTMNKSYVTGDEQVAIDMAERADKYGPIGPGTIFSIIEQVMAREGLVHQAPGSNMSIQEVFDKAKVAIDFDRKGRIKVEPSESNASSLIGAIFDKDRLYYDTRNDLYVFDGKSYSDTELMNRFVPLLQSTSSGLGLEKFRAGTIRQGIDILMAGRRVDPHQEYLKSLQWDGVSRIETFFIDYLGVDSREYHKIIGKNFWTALAARGLNPGSKFDSVLVLEGSEGIRKSSLVQLIGGADYTFAPLRKDAFENIDELRKMHQSVIVELPELIGLVDRSAEMVKAFLSSSTDSIRDLYARRAKQSPRGFVIVGTTNSQKYLSHHMGLRRFWPIRIPKGFKQIDTDKLASIRDQLFAEGIAAYKAGYEYWHVPTELLAQETAQRTSVDPIVMCIKNAVANEPFTDLMTIYSRLESSGYVTKGFDYRTSSRIETALTILGYTEKDDIWYAPAFNQTYGNII